MTKKHIQAGFSLLEVALTLFVLGFLFSLVPVSLSLLGSIQTAAPVLNKAEAGVNATLGFIVQHDRLPCPDTTGDGFENCGNGRTGQYPYRSVGLGRPLVNAQGFAFHYGVYQHASANLSSLQSSYNPVLLSGQNSGQSNALDFCQGLRLGLSGGTRVSEVSIKSLQGNLSINPAFILVDPGSLDADQDGRPFDGDNARGLVFESAGRALSDTYDDQITALSFVELSSRLSCPHILARVSAAARDANAAYDMHRSYAFYLDFRAFGKKVREFNLEMAKTRQNMVFANSAISAGFAANDVTAALTNPSGAAAAAAAAAGAAIAAKDIAEAIEEAEADVGEKNKQLQIAEQQFENAETTKGAADTYRDAATAKVLAHDAQGWFQ